MNILSRKLTQRRSTHFPLRSCSRLLSLAILAGSTFLNSTFLNASIPLRKDAPEFVRVDLHKKKLDLRAFRGKVVLLNFWATWCGPCKLEIPRFVAWQSEYGSRGLQIIGISMDDDLAAVQRTSEKLTLNYPVALGDSALSSMYGDVSDLPHTFLIDTNGKVQGDFAGEVDLNDVEKRIIKLLPR